MAVKKKSGKPGPKGAEPAPSGPEAHELPAPPASELHVRKQRQPSGDASADPRARNEPRNKPDGKPRPGDPAREPDTRQASSKRSDSQRSDSQRSTSRVNPRKVSEGLKQLPPNAYRFVRESYLLLDSDGSGSVSRDTMRDMLASLGLQDSGDKRLDAMLARAGEPVTFAGYLSVMGELLGDLPSQEEMGVMLEAFQAKDGKFDEKDLRSALADEGLSSEEISSVMARFSKPSRYGPVFDPQAFASTMSI